MSSIYEMKEKYPDFKAKFLLHLEITDEEAKSRDNYYCYDDYNCFIKGNYFEVSDNELNYYDMPDMKCLDRIPNKVNINEIVDCECCKKDIDLNDKLYCVVDVAKIDFGRKTIIIGVYVK